VWLGLAALAAAGAARAQVVLHVPGTMNFQGVLLDSAEEPINGTVTLEFSLHSTPTGGGTLWEETHTDVQVTDGIYDVVLGASEPLEPAEFLDPTRYLEIRVNGQVLSPRRQLHVVPYALRAESAHSASTATTALNVGGVAAAFVSQMYQHGDFDGSGLPNSHPTEGLVDTDADGAANFIDADNDDDGLSDAAETSQGSNPNVVTPTLTGFNPPSLLEQTPAIVAVIGTNFDVPGLSVQFGLQPPQAPTLVTPELLQLNVQGQPAGTRTVTISSSNGESVVGSYVFRPIARHVRAFVTAALYSGNLGGLVGADQKCQQMADLAQLGGTFLAWISIDTDATRTADRWPTDSVFDLVNGFRFASSYAELVGAGPHNPPLAITQSGGGLPPAAAVWTGGGSNATLSDCNDWTNGSPSFNGTRATVGSGNWQNGGTLPCHNQAHLYCFEQ
jgi:hypothetical protein